MLRAVYQYSSQIRVTKQHVRRINTFELKLQLAETDTSMTVLSSV